MLRERTCAALVRPSAREPAHVRAHRLCGWAAPPVGRAWARGAGALLLSTARRRLSCLGGGAPLRLDGRFHCYSFCMGECNDLSPAINAEFMYLERLGPLCSI